MNELSGAGVLVVGFLIGWVLRPYFVKRSQEQGKYDAILENLGTIKTKVEVTERAAAEIKAEVEQQGWRERERMVLMRNKLEATLAAGLELSEAVDRLRRTVTDKDPEDHLEVAENKLHMLTTLYFPELRPTAAVVKVAATELAVSARGLNIAFQMYKATHDVDPHSADTAKALQELERMKDRNFAEFPDALKRFLAALAEFSKAAAVEMTKYVP